MIRCHALGQRRCWFQKSARSHYFCLFVLSFLASVKFLENRQNSYVEALTISAPQYHVGISAMNPLNKAQDDSFQEEFPTVFTGGFDLGPGVPMMTCTSLDPRWGLCAGGSPRSRVRCWWIRYTQASPWWKRPWFWKDWRKEEKAMTEDEMVGWHHWLSGMSLSKLQEMVKDRETWGVAVHGVPKCWARLSDWTTTTRPVLFQSCIPQVASCRSECPQLSEFNISSSMLWSRSKKTWP